MKYTEQGWEGLMLHFWQYTQHCMFQIDSNGPQTLSILNSDFVMNLLFFDLCSLDLLKN